MGFDCLSHYIETYSFRSRRNLASTFFTVAGEAAPIAPDISFVSIERILSHRTVECDISPLSSEEESDACHCRGPVERVVMNATTTCSSDAPTTSAGRRFSLDKSVNGNTTRVMSPFSMLFLSISPLDVLVSIKVRLVEKKIECA